MNGTEEDGASLGAYWVKVMRLFEQIPSAQWFVGAAAAAVQVVPPKDPTAVSEWGNILLLICTHACSFGIHFVYKAITRKFPVSHSLSN